MECAHSGEDRACRGWTHGAACGHVFHYECIARWCKMRGCCPLCSKSWIFPQGLSITQLAAAKLVDNQAAVLSLMSIDLHPSVYETIAQGWVLGWPRPESDLSGPKQPALARLFGRYLTVEQLDALRVDAVVKEHHKAKERSVNE